MRNLLIAFSLLCSIAALASETKMSVQKGSGLSFVAPTVNGLGLVPNPEPGLIVFDVVTGLFQGKNWGSSTSWTPLGGTTPPLVVQKPTGAYSILSTDDVIFANATGGGFALTFPTASLNPGKVIRVVKVDSTTNAVTLSGFSGQLSTQNESREYISDGSSWNLTNWQPNTGWVSWIPTASAGFGSVTGITAASRRQTDSLQVNVCFTAGTVAASIGTVSLGFNGTDSNVTTSSILAANSVVGNWIRSGTTANQFSAPVLFKQASSLVNFGFTNGANSAQTAQNVNALISSAETFCYNALVPISGWGQ